MMEKTLEQSLAKQNRVDWAIGMAIGIVVCGTFFGGLRYLEQLNREEQLPQKRTYPITTPAVCASEVRKEGSGLDAILYCKDYQNRELSCRKEKGTTICYTLADKIKTE